VSCTFKAWDELNSEEQFAHDIEARSANEAAKLYAYLDADGNADGIYSSGQPISVRCPDGILKRFSVRVEYEPVYYATETKAPNG